MTTLAALLLYLPLLLNDLANLADLPFPAWLAQDYASRLLVLAGLAWVVRSGRSTPARLGLTLPGVGVMAAWTLSLMVVGLLMEAFGYEILKLWLPGGQLGGAPASGESWLVPLDLTLGLALVAVSEEALCRGLAADWLDGLGLSAVPAALVSALAFALIHWTLGYANMASAFVYGLLFHYALKRSGSIWPGAVAHYVVNLYAFA